MSNDECPKCKCKDIVAGDFDSDDNEAWREIECEQCGYKWLEVYKFSHLENILGERIE